MSSDRLREADCHLLHPLDHSEDHLDSVAYYSACSGLRNAPAALLAERFVEAPTLNTAYFTCGGAESNGSA